MAVTTTHGYEDCALDHAQIWTYRESFSLGSREEGLVRAPGNHPVVVENIFYSASCGGVFGILVPKSCGVVSRLCSWWTQSPSVLLLLFLSLSLCTLFGDDPILGIVMLD